MNSKASIENNPRVLFLVGPTAVGKSAVAMALAKRIGGEIVSCDSMQVYRGMDIGTAKPSVAMRQRVRHHLIDIVSPGRAFNVALYRQKALQAIQQILRRKKVPIVVGGTGLYFRALLDGIFRGPGPNRGLRKKLAQEAASLGSRALFGRLEEVDPAAAAKIHPHDTRKIMRALEVYHSARTPISALQSQWREKKPFPHQFTAIGLDMERGQLYRRVDARVEAMFRRGLFKEVRSLMAKGLAKNPIACQAIGYKEVIGWMSGQYDRAMALSLVQRNSRRFAKRQYTWFKKDARIQWLRVDPATTCQEVSNEIANRMTRGISSAEDHQS